MNGCVERWYCCWVLRWMDVLFGSNIARLGGRCMCWYVVLFLDYEIDGCDMFIDV
jgi:hypothetical protein